MVLLLLDIAESCKEPPLSMHTKNLSGLCLNGTKASVGRATQNESIRDEVKADGSTMTLRGEHCGSAGAWLLISKTLILLTGGQGRRCVGGAEGRAGGAAVAA